MKNKINTILFILLLVAGVAVWFSPADVESLQKENRELAPMPQLSLETLKNGSFMNEFEQFVNDNIGYRSYFTGAADKLRSYKGIEPPAGKVIYTEKDIGTQNVKKACLLQLAILNSFCPSNSTCLFNADSFLCHYFTCFH